MKRRIVLGLIGALAAATAGAETGITDKEIFVASCVDLEASAKVQSHDLITAAESYLASINEKGGIHGRKIRHQVFNDGYEPDKAIDCFNEVQKAGAFALMMSYGSPTGAKYATMALKNKVPYFAAGAGPVFFYEPVNRYLFVSRNSFIGEGKRTVQHLWNDLKLRKYAAIFQDDAGGSMILQGVRQPLEALGAPMVALGSFKRNTLEVDGAIAQVRAANPEVVFLLGPYTPHVEVLKKAKAAGWKPLFVAVGPRDPLTKAGDAAEGVIITQVMPPPDRTDLPGIVRLRSLLKKHAPNDKPSYYSVEGFASAMIFVEGLKRAGRDLTREKFVDSVESVKDFDLGFGSGFKANLSSERHGAFDGVIFTVVHNGKPVVFDDWSTLTRPAVAH